jgi:hypothetical protein
VQEDVALSREGRVPEGKRITRRYRDGAARDLTVVLGGTYTRIGAIKDYSLARAAQGWTEAAVRIVPLGTGQECRVQALQHASHREVAASVYCSAGEVIPDFRRAELTAARDKLLGRGGAWGQAYVVVKVEDGATDEQATERVFRFLAELAPQLQEAIASS